MGIALLVAYTSLLLVAAASTGLRVIRFRRARLPAPRLLFRDLILVGGHAVVFVLILGARVLTAAGIVANLSQQPWWWIVTSGPPLVAIAVYVYFELFVIR